VFWELTEMNSSIDFLVARPPVGVRARNGKYSDENGLMARRIASINDLPISESVHKFFWLLGRCPDDHAGLSELGL
jgi:nuclear transport factor 2 (NTF2) superfamily protein